MMNLAIWDAIVCGRVFRFWTTFCCLIACLAVIVAGQTVTQADNANSSTPHVHIKKDCETIRSGKHVWLITFAPESNARKFLLITARLFGFEMPIEVFDTSKPNGANLSIDYSMMLSGKIAIKKSSHEDGDDAGNEKDKDKERARWAPLEKAIIDPDSGHSWVKSTFVINAMGADYLGWITPSDLFLYDLSATNLNKKVIQRSIAKFLPSNSFFPPLTELPTISEWYNGGNNNSAIPMMYFAIPNSERRLCLFNIQFPATSIDNLGSSVQLTETNICFRNNSPITTGFYDSEKKTLVVVSNRQHLVSIYGHPEAAAKGHTLNLITQLKFDQFFKCKPSKSFFVLSIVFVILVLLLVIAMVFKILASVKTVSKQIPYSLNTKSSKRKGRGGDAGAGSGVRSNVKSATNLAGQSKKSATNLSESTTNNPRASLSRSKKLKSATSSSTSKRGSKSAITTPSSSSSKT